MYPDFGKLLDGLFKACIIAIPLAVWKVVDIIVWVFKHVRLDFQ